MKDETYFQDEETVGAEDLPDMFAELEPTQEAPPAPDLFEASIITLIIRYLPITNGKEREVVICAQQEGGLGLVELCRISAIGELPGLAGEALAKLRARITTKGMSMPPAVNVVQPAPAKSASKPATKKPEAAKTLSLFDL